MSQQTNNDVDLFGAHGFIENQRRAEEVFQAGRIILQWLEALMTLLSLALLVVLHWRFGARSLNPLSIAAMTGLTLGIGWLLRSPAIGTYGVVAGGIGLMHWLSTRRWFVRSPWWHSRSTGLPWPIWHRVPKIGSNDLFVSMYAEPALVLVLSGFARSIDPFLGVFLTQSALALFVLGQVQMMRSRNRLLDAIDAQIEGEALSQQLKLAHAPKLFRGFIVPGPPPRTPMPTDPSQSVDNAFARLPEGLLGLLGRVPSVDSRVQDSTVLGARTVAEPEPASEN